MLESASLRALLYPRKHASIRRTRMISVGSASNYLASLARPRYTIELGESGMVEMGELGGWDRIEKFRSGDGRQKVERSRDRKLQNAELGAELWKKVVQLRIQRQGQEQSI